MSSSLYHPCFLFISSLLFLVLIFSGDVPSAAGTLSPGAPKSSARAMNRVRRNMKSTEFLNEHNTARAAAGAPNLKWDQGLARFASNWAKQRKSDCKMTHSGGPYGENIFWYRRSENWSPKRVVAKWVAESLNYDRNTNTCASGQMCGHYTQIVWRTTTAVGCARAKCNNNRGFLVVCEYSPGGNYEGESPFDLPK
ncbi:hypothetical protein EUTSA_v10015461mg [Eutrema salsugineum]|uniref:SCP domain-containing protein n=1 Tax=Eutrema salsugineum TaxID=72664 RepID=V4L961_EUTSA|nr:pathogenesis-related protein PRB1-3 [Eutrema salsugineum]ESQ40179.1 hypothetical protein EUTSA_v10015461mg [Eutrema salsugineum]